MSWIDKLYKTYDNNVAHVGDRNDKVALLPMCHWIQNAQIEIAIDARGNFLSGLAHKFGDGWLDHYAATCS